MAFELIIGAYTAVTLAPVGIAALTGYAVVQVSGASVAGAARWRRRRDCAARFSDRRRARHHGRDVRYSAHARRRVMGTPDGHVAVAAYAPDHRRVDRRRARVDHAARVVLRSWRAACRVDV